MAAVERTLLGGERLAALWLYDAQIQKHVSHTNCVMLLYIQWQEKVMELSPFMYKFVLK